MAEADGAQALGQRRGRIAVFAPSPVLTVTIERGAGDQAEVHLHAGAQGFWVARMAASLGAQVRLCVALGGESGVVLRSLLAVPGVSLLAVPTSGANGAYLHDRRAGTRSVIAEQPGAGLQRHEVDELYGLALTAGLESDLTLLTGPQNEDVLPSDVYRRLSSDLRKNGRRVLADLTADALRATLEGGVDLVKLSSRELIAESRAERESLPELAGAVERLHREGAANVLVSRAEEPSLALVEGRLLQIAGPRFTAVDPQGTGDSMFAALAVGLAGGLELTEALRLGVAAGALNATRHGLGSGDREQIAHMLANVEVHEVPASGLPGAVG